MYAFVHKIYDVSLPQRKLIGDIVYKELVNVN